MKARMQETTRSMMEMGPELEKIEKLQHTFADGSQRSFEHVLAEKI